MSGFYGGTLPVGVSSVGSGASSFGDLIKKLATSSGGGNAGPDGGAQTGANGGGNQAPSTLTLEDVAAGVQEIVVERRYLAEPVIESFGLRLTEDNEVLAVEQGKLCSFFKVPLGSIILYVNNRFVETNSALYSECAKTLDVRLKCYSAKAMTDLVAQYLDQDNVRFDEVYEKDHIAYGFLSSTHPLHLHWQRRLDKARETKETLKALEFDIEHELKEKEGQEAEEAMKLLMQLGSANDAAPGKDTAPPPSQQGGAGPGVIGKLGLGSIRTVSSIVGESSSFEQAAAKKGPQSTFFDDLDRDEQQRDEQGEKPNEEQGRSGSRRSSTSQSDSESDSDSSGSRSRSSTPLEGDHQNAAAPGQAEGEAVSDDQLLALIGLAPPAEIDPIAAFLAEQMAGAGAVDEAINLGYPNPTLPTSYAMPQPPPIPRRDFFAPGLDFAPDVLDPIPFLRPKPRYPSDPVPGVGLGTVDQLRNKLEKGLGPDLGNRKRRGKGGAGGAVGGGIGGGRVPPPPAPESMELCRDYKNGHCKFGSGCRFRHISPRKRPRYEDDDRPTGSRRDRERDDWDRERERERDRAGRSKPSGGGAPSSRADPPPTSGDRRQSRHERESRVDRGAEGSRPDRHSRDEKKETPREDREGRSRHRGGSREREREREREGSERRDDRRHHKSSRRH
jgi:hypothetical protein